MLHTCVIGGIIMKKIIKIISVFNNKGGVGKTTTALNISNILANYGHRVLLIDMDPQANATNQLIQEINSDNTIYEVLINNVDITDAINSTLETNLDVVRSNLKLQRASNEMLLDMSRPRENRLKNAIRQIDDKYNYIVIDCPPSADLLVQNALVASTDVLIPMKADMYSFEGLEILQELINNAKENFNNDLQIAGAFVNFFDGRAKINDMFHKEVQESLNFILNTTIGYSTNISKNTFTQKAIVNTNHKIGKQYHDLIAELGWK